MANGVGVPLTGWLMGRYGVVRTFVAVGAAVHHRLVPVRHRLEPAVADLLPGAAGRRVRADDPRLPGAADLHLSGRQARHRAGIWSITTLVAPICGPILGGYISDNYHWGWIFLINVPVGLVVPFDVLAQSLKTPRDADPQAADRHGRAWACWSCGSVRCR